MKSSVKNKLYWAPRLLGILFALFISIFALDVFNKGQGVWQTIFALTMHLIPTLIVVLILILAWRREWVGAILFAVLAIAYLLFFWGRFPVSTYIIMTAPLWIVSILFAVNWKYRSIIRA